VNGSPPIDRGVGKKRRQPCGVASCAFLAEETDAVLAAAPPLLTAAPFLGPAPPFLDAAFLDGVPLPDGVPRPDALPLPDAAPLPDRVPPPDAVPLPDGVPRPDAEALLDCAPDWPDRRPDDWPAPDLACALAAWRPFDPARDALMRA
jgi:hypothetical protein